MKAKGVTQLIIINCDNSVRLYLS